ncbi:DUF86 domain-containing protein [Imperialibacter roseus]|uniref:DUF86 domain-containing protein n=1 Tax=Imperialibacter roseus TaxID=1324217 RepID=A0ABZ0ISJ4_9BACT|nr:DUF86 domain-containing protein [Imperialibacter roseus]WOK06562.1 DUF86 domain-containing protein [Imperialibacter roseus]|tara:strand:+ start:15306 stop:15659 length:354 start_codon:yes stop_codon:yes gene_type:complete
MRGRLGDEVRLRHIYDAILEIELYVAGKSFSDFMDNSMMRFACIKQLEIVGEASNHISAETKNIFSSVEWTQIVGMRNIFVHEYFGIDANLVWEILTNDIPELKDKVKEILDGYSSE